MYALNLNLDNRILSATYDRFAPPEQPRVETLPDGNVSDYLFVNGEYVYDPIPVPQPPAEDCTVKENISKGEYFMLNGKLYLATAAIPKGTKAVVRSNCEKTDMVSVLNTLQEV